MIILILLFIFSNAYSQVAQDYFEREDAVLINEVFNVQKALGQKVWPDWQPEECPFLYKTPEFDFLLYHQNPGNNFKKLNNNLNLDIFYRSNNDPADYQTITTLDGQNTVVMSAPNKGENLWLWIFKGVHELFHINQFRSIDKTLMQSFLINKYDKYTDLDFPFEYDNKAVMALCRLEAETIFKIITADSVTKLEKKMSRQVFKNFCLLQDSVFKDNEHKKYKQKTEWIEGVSRYVERKMALLAIVDKMYAPSLDFITHFPDQSLDDIEEYYLNMVNPVRFVGEGVKYRTMFYYSGMGKAYLLDRLQSDWKEDYLSHCLDDLITRN